MRPETTSSTSVDPFAVDATTITERPSAHRRLRESGPVVQVEAPAGGPMWLVTEEQLARQVLTDDRFVKDPGLAPSHWHGQDPSLEPPLAAVRAVTTMDGTEHRRMRRVQAPPFTRRRLLAGRDRMVGLARTLLDRLADESADTGAPVDLVADFAVRYPLLVICDLLGLPADDIDRAIRASATMTHGDAEEAHAALHDLGSAVGVAARADLDPADDGSEDHGDAGPGGGNGGSDSAGENLTVLLARRARDEFGEIADEDLTVMITGLVFAAQVTTESFLSYLLAYRLAGRTGEIGPSVPQDGSEQDGSEQDGSDPAGLEQDGLEQAEERERLISEVLRLHPPAPFTLWRFAATEVELGDVTLPAGAPVLVDIEGISAHPERHREPERFDPDRPPRDELVFGAGPHVCIGSQLARLEGQVVLEVLASDFPEARLAVAFDQLRRDRTATQSHRLAGLPVWLRPEAVPRAS